MANQSLKKNKQTRDQWNTFINPFYYTLQVIYFLQIIYTGNYFSFWEIMWLIVYSYLEFKLMNMILAEVENGSTPSWTLDCFGILVLSQLVSLFSQKWGFIALFLFPAYLVYKFGPLIYSYFVKSKQIKSDQPIDEAEVKRLAKKEKKQQRVKYVKH